MTAPAQDWAEKAEAIVTEWWSEPSPDDNPDPVFDGQRAAIVTCIALALSDAARTGREEVLHDIEALARVKLAEGREAGLATGIELIATQHDAENATDCDHISRSEACERLDRALRGKEPKP